MVMKMKLSDLKTGMYVETRCGIRYLVLKDFDVDFQKKGILSNENMCLYLNYFNDNMKYITPSGCGKKHDIMEVFEPSIYLNKKDLVSIWKREEIKISLSEFEKTFLESLNPEYKWLAKNGNDIIFLYTNKPEKDDYIKSKYWTYRGDCIGIDKDFYCDAFKKEPFEWVKWEDEEPWYIPDLLKGE